LGFEIRLKTGFYETKPYDLLISKNRLVLSSAESGEDMIFVHEKEILFVSLREKKHSEIEIQTLENSYQAVFCDNTDFEEVLRILEDNLHAKIICECLL